ncbi:MAG: metallophosphoesterase [Candidatus Omnitrophota bacterium]|nr:MAG: metallophosphoesterase [Candidatus Omnitrophota bacterium]
MSKCVCKTTIGLFFIAFLIALYAFWALFRFPSQCIVVYGDTRTGHASHKKVVDAIMKLKPRAVFHAGDLVGNGHSHQDWALFNEITRDLTANSKFYPALGNHEYHSQLFFDNFKLPHNEQWYSIALERIHFVVLDSTTDLSQTSEQYDWLKEDLENVGEEIKFIIVVFHHPPFTVGMHSEDEKGLQQSIVPLFEQYGVDMVFSGHNHAYERLRVNGIYYIVTGGGGAPLYPQARQNPYSQVYKEVHHFCTLLVKSNTLVVNVFDTQLRRIDQFRVRRSL